MPRFSVIVPAYQVQAYLSECLDSVLSQSYPDLEVIAVDDASPDACGEIIDEYAARDPRVKPLHLAENRGLGRARNAGIAQAGGEYLIFLDSDDTLTPGSLAAIAERIEATWREKLLRETGQTLRELQDTLDAAGHRLQAGLLNIQEAAQGRDDLFHVEELTHALQGRLDVITSWGQQCIELWSRYDRHVHKFIRNAIDMDKNRAFSQRLVSANIEAKIKGREKNLYSIHQKMQAKNLRFAEVMDIYGFRVIVNNVPACYAALGALHNLYQPKPGRIKDYIAIPKSNGYQSLHTTLVGPYGLPIEVQIRTREMDAVAEGGVAGHWIYKSGENTVDQATLRTNQWLQNILDLQARSANAMEFLEHVKVDLFPDEVYILTPKGKILVLPDGATPIDFAYALHSSVGDRCRGAKVEGQIVPLSTPLENGQRVEIITAKEGSPSVNWLYEGWVKSPRAISKIRAGADVVQIYTGLIYEGPGLPSRAARAIKAMA